MSNVYLVALLISNASGHVESIEAVDAVTQGGCKNMARLHLMNEPTPPGYELKLNCGSREALETAIAEHNCREVNRQDNKGTVSTVYACDPNDKNKFVGWIKSVL